MTPSATCNLCGEQHDNILEHLRLIHPDVYGDGPARWPDGEIVVVDETLTPEEFR
jgi:hypothetical protein